jgi:zinc transport system ATP-binding protein
LHSIINDEGSALTAVDAAFGYDGHIVVRKLSFSVAKGGYLCVVGENGSGKSTLIKGILRLITPVEGRINFGAGIGKNGTGYLSQQTAAKKDFPAGVYEIVVSGHLGGMGLRPFYSRKEKQSAEENMERLGVADLRDCCFRELSGGQQRRTLIARALCAGRQLLVLDEPAAGLDPLITADVYSLLEKLNRELGLTIIMVSHDIEAAVKYARTILHLKKIMPGGVNEPCYFGSSAEYTQLTTRRELYAQHTG